MAGIVTIVQYVFDGVVAVVCIGAMIRAGVEIIRGMIRKE